ncbi:MAG: alpha/beta hydrolase, partial [Campylobacterales bacterium]|nr:alpha/beta hydrolase [Campylobacterales bacterium]
QNMYETLKNVVNEDFRDSFRTYKGNAQIFWGISDTATSLSSGEEISKIIKNSQFYPMEGDHYFFLNKGKEIEKKITLL